MIHNSYGQVRTVWCVLAVLASVTVFAAGLFLAVLVLQRSECRTKASDLGRGYRYGLIAGCRVESDAGEYVPIDNLRITNEEVR